MLGGQQQFIGPGGLGERFITRIPGRTLKAGTGPNLHANHLQRYTQRITDRLAMLRPRVRRRLKAVMNVNGFERGEMLGFCEMGKKVKKDRGIKTTGEGDAPGCGIEPGSQVQKKPGG